MFFLIPLFCTIVFYGIIYIKPLKIKGLGRIFVPFFNSTAKYGVLIIRKRGIMKEIQLKIEWKKNSKIINFPYSVFCRFYSISKNWKFNAYRNQTWGSNDKLEFVLCERQLISKARKTIERRIKLDAWVVASAFPFLRIRRLNFIFSLLNGSINYTVVMGRPPIILDWKKLENDFWKCSISN